MHGKLMNTKLLGASTNEKLTIEAHKHSDQSLSTSKKLRVRERHSQDDDDYD